MSSETRPGNLIVVTAPSGAGKTTLCRAALERLGAAARFSISHTTRAPRGQERDGVDYHFVPDAEFDRMVAAGELAEWASIHDRRYGTSRREIDAARAAGTDLLMDIDGQGGMQVKAAYPHAALVFVLPPDEDELRERLSGRGTETPEQVTRRLANARRELAFAAKYDYIIVNDELDRAVADLVAIVVAARRRRENMLDALRRFDPTP